MAYTEYRNVDPAVEVALYYGFTPLPSPITITKEDREKARAFGDVGKADITPVTPKLEERSALFRHYEEKGWGNLPQPVMLCTEFFPGTGVKKKPGEHRLSLEIMGGSKSIAEATLVKTAFAMLGEEGHSDLCLSINSVGDRESMGRFVRELGNYHRKHTGSLPQSCKALLRRNPLDLLACGHEKCRTLAEEAPKSMNFLGEESRKHFKEVLEFLEELGIPYEIDHSLIGNRLFATETVFEIRDTSSKASQPDARPNDAAGQGVTARGPSTCLCSGVRYNNLGRRLGLKKEVPSIGMNLYLERTGKELAATRRIRFKKPFAFFLQLGFCAKLKSLQVIEVLRQAKIPLYQALNRDKLISQMSSAENLKIPYSIILGQREALENSVIVRNTSTRAQETVPLRRLAEYFQKMKLG